MQQAKTTSKDLVTLFVLKALKSEGIDHAFFVPGYLIDYFLPYMKLTGITPIVAAHEAGAAYMADGYARASNKFGLCMGIGGPGVTNMVTPIASAYADRSPVLVISGKISREDEAKGTFQDSSSSSGIDDMAIMRTVTEFAATVPTSKSVGVLLRKAIRVINDVESLPVFLSIPMDIQTAEYDGRPYVELDIRKYRVLDEQMARIAADIITGATRIAIFAGNGVVRSEAGDDLRSFAEQFGIPVVTTLRAKGAIDEHSEASFGVFGLGGSLQANVVIAGRKNEVERPEVLLVLGATLNENNTFGGTMPKGTKDVILLDINPNSNRDIEAYAPRFVMGDVKTFIEWMLQQKGHRRKLSSSKAERQEWLRKITSLVPEPCEELDDKKSQLIHPGRAILELRKVADEREETRCSVVVPDSGAHTFFTGHYWRSYGPNEFLVMTNMGPMGYSIAAGIGAKLAQKSLGQNKPVICVVGDGGMLMHGIEIQSAVRSGVPLLVVVINNGALGNVYLRFTGEDYTRLFKNNEGVRLTSIDPRHRWDEFAKSLGAEAIRVEHKEELAPAYRKAFECVVRENRTFLVDIVCDRNIGTPNMALPKEDRMKALGVRVRKDYHTPWFG